MRSMSNLEYSYLCQELKSLTGGRLNNIYDMENGEFRLRFRVAGRYEDVSVRLGERMHLTRYIKEAPKTPSNLAMLLRKRIVGMKLETVLQHDFDRIVVFRFTGETPHSLIFEMFGEGNLLLIDRNGKITRCFRQEEWKGRILKEGHEYKFPISERVSPPFSPETLSRILEPKPVISVLIAKTNFGNDYLEEACRRAGCLKDEATKLDSKNIASLAEILNEIKENAKPLLYLKDRNPFDYSLAKLTKYSELEVREMKTLSEAIDECANFLREEKGKQEPAYEKKLRKLEKRLILQREHYAKILKESEECRKKGDEIYARYGEVEDILKNIKNMRRNGKSWDEIKKDFEGKCMIDEKKGIVFILG